MTLAGTALDIWDLLATPSFVSELSQALADRHRTDPSTVERDLAPMIERLALLDAIEPEA